jgi:uncharacterized protein (DUF433 family)
MTYEEWKDNLVKDPEILGGATVFPNSRLSVSHIGVLYARGVINEIKEDYPYLSDLDIKYSFQFACEAMLEYIEGKNE